ncbi:MAG: aminoacyl-tRNA hydrolase [candidate division KSB1 bacterium]|nr:aminoacyl-tRNA hydrolase [candidate division KSB1 bacterium]MDZ7274775.1 aminoacyl-tRNA hydrolase [candidate division KSB1 bacterium]MDZ7285599.1 aminoacyl-tRNA hydrolase [candidate division KSB1 bacterium]MDZ7298631.1 aminoacyl-tRNA hydrolase [candidate division KSB1 bacterium]MDZ7307641.1 aminoacyl-tRNA hydrolase [candidate division KSB1 bacterium]
MASPAVVPARFLIAGLGNPGREYAGTRHNLGFMVIDHLAERLGVTLYAGRGDYRISSPHPIPGSDSEIVLLKPLTFMNNSGIAVREVVHYFKFELSHLLVVLDDFQLPFGRIRLRARGSDGGQKGLRSIISALGTEDIPRLRLGIGQVAEQNATAFVLSRFSPAEREALPGLLAHASEAVLDCCRHGIAYAMNRYNTNKNPED